MAQWRYYCADRRRFYQRVAGIMRQFSNYTALDSLHLNGNIANL